MSRHGSVCSLIALGAMLALAGCGSGSSDSVPQLPDNQLPPPVQSGGESISISGQVTDMPIANAIVTVTVDGQSFTANAPTDAQGNYTVEISSADPDAIVLMEAVDPGTGVHFTAVLDDYAGFEDKADENGNVSDIDVTNVTTAHFVLATNASDDGSIDNAAELEEMADRVDPGAVLQLAAAIKLVVENIQGVVLPPGLSNTQELAEAIIDGTTSFLDDVAAAAPGALEEAVDLVINDGNATLAWNADTAPGVYVHQEGLAVYTLFADGTGKAKSFESAGVAEFQWAVTEDGKLLVSHYVAEDGQDLVTILSRHRNMLTVVVEEQTAAGELVAQEPTNIAYFPFADGFTNSNAPGTYSTIGEPGHVKVLLPDHTGYDLDLVTGEQSGEFYWEVDSSGTMHLANPAGILMFTARVLGGAEDGGMHLLVTEHGAEGGLLDLNVITVRRADESASTPTSVADLDLLLAGNTYAWYDDSQMSLFRFRADGVLRVISQFADSTGQVELENRLGEWTMADASTIRTWFADRPGHEDASVVSGLGADQMVVQTPEDVAAGTTKTALRILPIEVADVAGAFYFTDVAGAIQGDYVIMDADFSGQLWENGAPSTSFEWSIDEHGALVITLDSEQSFHHETLTLHMLAGSNIDSNMSFIAVRRLNGQLHLDEEGNALRIVYIWREG